MSWITKILLGVDVTGFRKGLANADNSLKKFSRQLTNLGGLIGASFAGAQIISFTKEAVTLGSQMEQVAQGFKRFGSEMDLERLRESTKGLVTDLELMKATVQAGNFGIPIQEMGDLLEFAQRRAAESGVSVDYLVNSIVVGIGRKSPKILDNLGISAARLSEAFNGAAVEAQSIGDVTQVVSDIAREELAKMGEYVDTAADKVKRFETSWDNFKTSFGQTIGPVVAGFLDWMAGALEEMANFSTTVANAFSDIADAAARIPVLLLGGADISTGTSGQGAGEMAFLARQQMVGMAPESVWWSKQNQQEIKAAVVTLSSLQDQLKGVNEEFQNTAINTPRFFELRTQIDKLEQNIKDLTDGVVPMTQGVNAAAKEVHGLNVELQQSGEIMRRIPSEGNEYTKYLENITAAYAELENQMNFINYLGEQFGDIFRSAFDAALEGSNNFFDTVKEGFKNYVKQILAMTAATTALAVAIAFVTGGANFKAAFNAVGGAMGTPFGFNDGGEFGLKGRDFFMGFKRNQGDIIRNGG